MSQATRHLCALLACAAAATEMVSAQATVTAPVATVTDAVFRSEWTGPQADRPDFLGMVPTGEGIEPVGDVATKLREGLWLGSLRVRPGVGAGYAYSNRNYQGQTTTADSDQSPYFSPTLGLEYGRDTGPWSISARAGGGYTWYLNPDYAPDGTGANRNPFNGTASLGIDHSGLRHKFGLDASASLGNGQNIQGGGTSTQLQANVGADYTYELSEFVTTGSYVTYNNWLTGFEDGDINSSDISSLRGGGSIDWLFSGKATVGLKTDVGRSTQNVSGGLATREFVEMMVPVVYSLTSKVVLNAGLGARYTQDPNIPDASSQYTGLSPVYMAGATYTPTEKTSVRLFTSFEGFDIVPSYGLTFTWRPREVTAFTLSAYQNQNFSITTLDQFQVNRGIVAGVEQMLFSRLTTSLSGGWQQTENISLSDDVPNGNNYSYGFVSAQARWALNSWAYWQATIMTSTGNQVGPGSSSTYPWTTASIGLNLLF